MEPSGGERGTGRLRGGAGMGASEGVSGVCGGVFPVSVFGSTYEAIAKYIPLTYTVNYPIQILAGTVPAEEAVRVLGIQLVWILILAAVARIAWACGLKKYVVVGG